MCKQKHTQAHTQHVIHANRNETVIVLDRKGDYSHVIFALLINGQKAADSLAFVN